MKEFNLACSKENLPQRESVDAIKQAWNKLIKKCKTVVAANRAASGIAEEVTEHDERLDEYIESQPSSLSQRPGRRRRDPTDVEWDRQMLAQIAGSVRKSPATRSMSTLRERSAHRSSNRSETESCDASESQVRKKSKSAAQEALDDLTAGFKEQHEEEMTYHCDHLEWLKTQAEAQTKISESQVSMNEKLQFEFRAKTESMEQKMERMEAMMSSMMSILQGMTSSSRPSSQRYASAAPELPPTIEETTPTRQRVRGLSIASDVTTPTKRQYNTCSRSQTRDLH